MWRERFVEALGPRDGDKVDLDGALALRDDHLPARLFRYRTAHSREFDLLERDAVWMTAPDDFDDPYDSGFCLDSVAMVQELLRQNIRSGECSELADILTESKLMQVAESPSPFSSLAEAALEADEFLAGKTVSELAGAMKGAVVDVNAEAMKHYGDVGRRHLRVACFSESNDSLLLWAHHADGHRGVCVAYDYTVLPRLDPRRRMLMPVIYSDKRFDGTGHFLVPRDEGVALNPWVAVLAALHKSNEWSYEKEWRLVGQVHQSCAVPEAVALYLGSHSDDSTRRAAEELARRRAIPLYEMRPQAGRFALAPIRLS